MLNCVTRAMLAPALGLALAWTAPSPASAQISIFGGAADLNLKLDPLVLGGKSAVTIDVLAKRAVSARRVYVELRCTETVAIENYKVPSEQGKQNEPERRINVRQQEITESKEFVIGENVQYLANSTHKVTGTIELPTTFPVPARGKLFRVNCEARAGLDVFGNDPNSTWQDVSIAQMAGAPNAGAKVTAGTGGTAPSATPVAQAFAMQNVAFDAKAGPIFSQDEAKAKCAAACKLTWNGQWTTTVPNKVSVCGAGNAAGHSVGDVPVGPIFGQGEAKAKCDAGLSQISWDGQWSTTEQGKMSVCGCKGGSK